MRQSNIIGSLVSADRVVMATAIIRAIDQDPAYTGAAHLQRRWSFVRGLTCPMIPPINPRAKPLGIDAEIWIDANVRKSAASGNAEFLRWA
jgi:hypothetical protein